MVSSYSRQINELAEGLTWKSQIETPVKAVSVSSVTVQWWNLMGYREEKDPFEQLLRLNWDSNPSAWYQLARLFGSIPKADPPLIASFKIPSLKPLYCRYLLMNTGWKWVGVTVYIIENT